MSEYIPGVRLKRLRNGRRLREVAEAMGVTRQTIVNYESGKRIPNDNMKVKLADYYGKSVQEIFFDPGVNET